MSRILVVALLFLIALPAQAEQIQTVCFTPGEDCRALSDEQLDTQPPFLQYCS